MKNALPLVVRKFHPGRYLLVVALVLLGCGAMKAAPSPIGTGLLSNITLGALQNPGVVNNDGNFWINYDVDLNSWRYDVYVPPGYDGTKPYGVMVYVSSVSTGAVLSTAATDKNLIWIAPRNVQNNADPGDRFGAALLALYRAKELFNIDPRRVYTSGLSGGARVASALAFFHSELIHGTAPSSGMCMPRLSEVVPNYIPETSVNTDTYFDYSSGYFDSNYYYSEAEVAAFDATARANKLRSYPITRYDDHREEYIVESFHCAYEPQGQICFPYDGSGGHQDASDAEMEEAIDYLDRDDIFPVNANVAAGVGGFSGMTDVSQSGASAAEATTGGNTTYTLTPTLTAVAAAKTGSAFYWDNANGSTVRWLWEVKNAAPTNQKTSFGLWFANETWGGGAPTSLTAGSNPGILITITQNGSQNRMVISARPDAGGEVVFYDGYFSFVPAYSTAWTSTQTGYLTGTGSPVEIRMDLNKSRWQLTFNGIKLDGATNSLASGTQISRDLKRSISGYWDSSVSGGMFWKHDLYTAASNTWSPFTKSIFTAATGALSGAGAMPSPMELRYVIASDPNLPDPPSPGPTGLAGSFGGGAVNLTWDAVAGATSYTVRRSSVSGGPYTTLQSGVAGTSFPDSTVTTGNIYYYTVFATTASGDTALAPELAVGTGFQVDAWTGGGADGNWQTAANWNTLPAAGHTLAFATTTRLSNTNNFPANTSFGGLMFNAGAGAFTLGGNAITLTGNITNNVTYPQTVNLPVVLSAGVHNLTANTGNLSMSGGISGSGSVSKTGTGTATLSTANTYSGGTAVTAGTLAVGNAAALGTGAVTLNGGTLKASGGFTLVSNIAVSGASSFDMAGNNTTLSGSLSGSAALTLNNSGAAATMTFGNNSGYSGTITVNNGNAVSFNSANAGSANAAWVFNDSAGDRVRINIGGTNTLNFGSLAGSGQIQNDTPSSRTTLSVGALNTSTTFAGTFKDNGTGLLALLKTGTGTLGLTGASTYSGGTTINSGTIGVAGANGANTNLGAGAVTVNTGAILRPGYSVTSNQNVSTTPNAITLAGGSILADDANQHLSGAVTVSASGGTLGSTYNAGTNAAAEKDKGLALDGVVSGSGALTIQHSRISTGNAYNTSFVSFSNNANPYSGTITINENTTTSEGGVYLGVNGGTALQNATIATTAIPGGNLKFGASPVVFKTGLGSASLGAISGSGPLVLTGYDQVNHASGADAIALTVGGNSASTTYSGGISGLGGLTKTGAGTLTLSGTSTYAGATTISGGALSVTGSLGGAGTLTVNSGGTLAGTGTVTRATSVAGGGAMAPGNGGAGTLTLSGGLTLGDGAVLNMELAGTTTSDKINAGGAFSAAGTTTINLTALGGFAGAGTYSLITNAGSISAANFAVGTTPAGYGVVLDVSGGTLSATLVAPPAAPTGLTVTMGDGTAMLNWTAASGATSYTVLRSQTSGSGYAPIATGVTATNYTDTGLDPGATYYYKIASDNVAGSVTGDSEVGATTIPPAPGTLTVTAGNGQVALAWTASIGASGYTVLRATEAAGTYTAVATNVTETSYTDTGLDSGATYYYRIVATNDAGASIDSPEAGATTIPPAPAAVSASASDGRVALAWMTSAGATGYTVLRATSAAGIYAPVATGVTSTSHADAGVSNGTIYFYQIVATNDAGASAGSAVVSAMPAAPPALNVTGKARLATTKARITLRGKAAGTVTSVTWKIGRKTFTAKGTGAWRAKVRLEPGRNVITIIAHGADGTTAVKKIVIIRR
jgi:autotransporter-associated beta strand protein